MGGSRWWRSSRYLTPTSWPDALRANLSRCTSRHMHVPNALCNEDASGKVTVTPTQAAQFLFGSTGPMEVLNSMSETPCSLKRSAFFSLSFSLSFENSFSLQCGFLTATGLGSFSRKAKGSLVDIFIVSRFGRSRGMILECYKHRKRGRYPHNRSYEVREYTIPHHIRF